MLLGEAVAIHDGSWIFDGVSSQPVDCGDSVCECGYTAYVTWEVFQPGMTERTFRIEIWEDGAPTGGPDEDGRPPSGSLVGAVEVNNLDARSADVNVTNSSAISVGEHTIRAWVGIKELSEPNKWADSNEACVFDVVEVNKVTVDPNEACVGENVTFTAEANGTGTLWCVHWEKQYRADSNGSWGPWTEVGEGNSAVLNTNTAGQYRYRAFNGDSNTCATEANSIVTVVEVGDVNFGCTSVCVGGTCTASASIAPSGRDITWSIVDPNLGCDIDANSGVITAGTTAGTITVKGADANVPSCSDSNQLDVVDVGTIEIKYDDANWADVTDANIVVLKGSKYLFRVWPDPEGASWPSPPQWSGAASGAGIFKWVTFSSEGSETVTAKCCSTCGDGKTVNINVIKPWVESIDFGGPNNFTM
ncbi:MAG: hypothetical protein ACYS21_16240, partial [Planctomycetota bacterium]